MTALRIIALIGVTHSGKSIVSRRLRAGGFQRVRFADPIKAMLVSMGISLESMDGPERSTPLESFGGRTPQYLVKALSRWGRVNVDKDIWASRCAAQLATMTGNVVIDDLLDPEEADVVRLFGGAIVRVTRPGVLPPPHQARTLAIHADVELLNDSTPALLERKVDAILEALKGGL